MSGNVDLGEVCDPGGQRGRTSIFGYGDGGGGGGVASASGARALGGEADYHVEIEVAEWSTSGDAAAALDDDVTP
jgi:hypothetical protein